MLIDPRYKKSHSLATHAANYDAWVAAEVSSPVRRNYQFISGRYPLYGSHASGAYVWDIDGNRYTDYTLGYGTVILGHSDPEVTEAVQEEIGRGHCLSPLWKPHQAELCELICSIIPNAEQAFLMKTGSDATSGAVRLARWFTNRDRVIHWGYNGWHDWSTPRPAGVPASTRAIIHPFLYNDIRSVSRLFEQHGREIACVLMMPFELDPPEPGFLEEARELAHDFGALFILDEMRSGFRFALGGAQEFLKIQADLVTFSKAMANGHAVSCVTGRRDVLAGVAHTKMTATYFASAEGMVAALCCIRKLQRDPLLRRIWTMGERLMDGLRTLHGDIAEVRGYPPCPFLDFNKMAADQNQRAKEAFFAHAASEGVLLHPSHHWYLSASHTERDVDHTVEVCRRAMSAACAAI